MSDLNLTDKVSETITNIFKKTEVFEKIENIQFYLNSFVVISSIIGITSIYINYCNLDKIKCLEYKIKETEKILNYNIKINRKQNQIIYNKLIDELKKQVEISSKLISKITETQSFKPEMISASTSITSFSPLKITMPIETDDIVNQNDDWVNQNDYKNNNIDSDDELIKECYDSIPMNNAKKYISLNWLFK